MSEKPKIYILAGVSIGTTRTMNKAIAEDGETVAQGESPSLMRAHHDMGLTSGHGHAFYAKKYPDGYDLEFVSEPDRHDGLKRAIRRSLGEVVPSPSLEHALEIAGSEEMRAADKVVIDGIVIKDRNKGEDGVTINVVSVEAQRALIENAELAKTVAQTPEIFKGLAEQGLTFDIPAIAAALREPFEEFNAANQNPLLVPVPEDTLTGSPADISLPEIQQQASEVDGSSPSVAPEKAI